MRKLTIALIGTCLVSAPFAGISAQDLSQHPLADITNPVVEEAGVSDPHVLIVNDTVYLFTGHDIGYGVPNWVMPDWRIYRSVDLKTWEHVGTISPADNYMGAESTDCWAGDIVERNGQYYWFFSDRNRSAGVMVASQPEGPYKDAIGGPLVDSYDPTIFVDHDDTPYIIYGEGTYKIARLKDSLLELAEEPRAIELVGLEEFPCCGDKNALHRHEDTYYLSYSGLYATSDNVYGPYTLQGYVGEGFGVDTGYAHGEFFEWQEQWYHTWCRYRKRTHDRIRDTFIAPTYYTEDGKMYDDYRHIDPKYSSSGIK